MSNVNEGFNNEFIQEIVNPEKKLFNFVMMQLSREMTERVNDTTAILKYLKELKAQYRQISHAAIAADLRCQQSDAKIAIDSTVNTAMNIIQPEYGGPRIHQVYSVQEYLKEAFSDLPALYFRYGYNLEITHHIPALYYDTIDDWDIHIDGSQNLASILNGVRLRLAGMLYRKLDKRNKDIGDTIANTINAFCNFIINTETSLEYVTYKRKVLRSPTDIEQITILATQGRNELLCGLSVY